MPLRELKKEIRDNRKVDQSNIKKVEKILDHTLEHSMF